MQENITANYNVHSEMLLGVVDMIEWSLQKGDSVSDDVFTFFQFIMQQDLTGFSKEEMLRLTRFIRDKLEAVNGVVSDEYIIREIIEQDVELIVRPGEETFFDRNVPVVKSVLDNRKIKYRERHPGYDRVIFEFVISYYPGFDEISEDADKRSVDSAGGTKERKGETDRAELILDRVNKACIFRRKNEDGVLFDEEEAEIEDVLTEELIIRTVEKNRPKEQIYE